MKGILREIGRLQNGVPVFYDSQSAIHLATNPYYHSKTKHIDVEYCFVRSISLCTRPDISHAGGVVSKYMANPEKNIFMLFC